MSPTQGSCDNLGLWKSTNSDGNTNTDKKQFSQKLLGKGGQVDFLW